VGIEGINAAGIAKVLGVTMTLPHDSEIEAQIGQANLSHQNLSPNINKLNHTPVFLTPHD